MGCLIGLAGCWEREYGGHGSTATVIVPGFVETDMTASAAGSSSLRFWDQVCPLGRMGQPEEVAALAMFLASKEASFVNGQAIAVSGGLDWTP